MPGGACSGHNTTPPPASGLAQPAESCKRTPIQRLTAFTDVLLVFLHRITTLQTQKQEMKGDSGKYSGMSGGKGGCLGNIPPWFTVSDPSFCPPRLVALPPPHTFSTQQPEPYHTTLAVQMLVSLSVGAFGVSRKARRGGVGWKWRPGMRKILFSRRVFDNSGKLWYKEHEKVDIAINLYASGRREEPEGLNLFPGMEAGLAPLFLFPA